MTEICQADFCKVIPAKFSGAKGVVPLQRRKLLSPSGRQLTSFEIKSKQRKRLREEDTDGRAPVVKLGDASMAAPFTAKHSSVPTTDVICQSRSTSVTTLQMIKVLGLNCLATAYVLSVMYLDGMKLADLLGAQTFIPELEFIPNLVNTVSHMANMMIQEIHLLLTKLVATFVVNYIWSSFQLKYSGEQAFLLRP